MNAPVPDWRPILAALAHPDSGRVVAALMLGARLDDEVSPLPPSRRRHLLERLRAAGLLREEDGTLVFDGSVFAAALRGAATVRPQGVERFFRDGRLEQLPARPGDRDAVLAEVARRAFRPHEILDEPAVNERLSAFYDDTALLRRYLVDSGLLDRRRDGSEYASTRAAEPSP
ncbi:DUF2087 domain-containing protein [Microbacterium sp. TNHR37B]|uniref:DUF2087 domain-containing protein n=1 Tax=Microbacterium sp. TNHR37B TaxID=1775956 RepID=UPI0008323FC9|nr:DUF2087 domain-containing protein [Microbacterium sp. TNHR37B]